jgi:hypothetical protein
MADERLDVPLSDLVRWIVVGFLILGGIVTYLMLAPRTPAVAAPISQEAAS